MTDPYAVLGVARDAPIGNIRRAYVALARRTHPDMHPDDPAAAERMRRINEAWETLSDTESRAACDRFLRYRTDPGGAGRAGTATTGAWRPPASGSRHDSGGFSFDGSGSNGNGFGQDGFDGDGNGTSRGTFDGDDRAITGEGLPDWMRLAAPAAFVLGVFAVIFGVLLGGFLLVRLGLLALGGSAALFVLSPFVVLLRSRGGPIRR